MPVTISGTGRITGAGLNKKIEAFTASGTWTVPAGVTYAIAHVMGGGGGVGSTNTGGDGGDSSVVFDDGTITGPGTRKGLIDSAVTLFTPAQAGRDNIGQGGHIAGRSGSGTGNFFAAPVNVFVVGGGTVTPAASVTVTVGAGGTAGTSGVAGGSGYVYIEYYDG